MELQDIANALTAHELNSKMRFEVLRDDLQKHIAVETPTTTQGTTMEQPIIKNIFEPNPYGNAGAGMGGALGGGLGAGIVGGLLSQTLLGRNGLNGGDVVTPALLQTSLNQVQSNTDNAIAANERLTTARFDSEAQREIQAAIERTASATQIAQALQASAIGVQTAKGFGEVNTQNALVGSTLGVQTAKGFGEISTQIALTNAALGTAVEKTAAANALAITGSVKDNLAAYNQQAAAAALFAAQNQNALAAQLAAQGNAIQQSILQNKYDVTGVVKADGDQTRALINKLNDDTLNRLLTTAQNEIIELRGDREGTRRSRETEVNVTTSVNQNQNQLQAQAQQQQQFQVNAQMLSALNCLVAGHQNLQQGIVNLGTMSGSSGQQTAANTRVN